MRCLLLVLAICLTATVQAPPVVAAAKVSAYCTLRLDGISRPRPDCIRLATYSRDVCNSIARNADDFGLPRGYFARLIWQESHFNPNAVSWAGARGIAQFMPETGRLQGLENPYNPAEELYRSARYLKFLRGKFGNLGLAAAAYNGGENRVGRFVAGTGYLAVETLDYVQRVTGAPVTDWLGDARPKTDFSLDPGKPFQQACVTLAETRSLRKFTPPTAVVQPWGIQVAQFFSSATARRAFSRIQKQFERVLGREPLMLVAKRNPNFGPALRYTVEVGRNSRKGAQELCAQLAKAGGACIVVRNQ
jgi:transglycosylase-like protein with SLT domain/sporulation related protein